jgi:hypothetical protein
MSTGVILAKAHENRLFQYKIEEVSKTLKTNISSYPCVLQVYRTMPEQYARYHVLYVVFVSVNGLIRPKLVTEIV